MLNKYTSALKVRHAIIALENDLNQLRKAVMQFQRDHKVYLKGQRLEYKASLKAKKEAKARRKELKEKQNVKMNYKLHLMHTCQKMQSLQQVTVLPVLVLARH
jgi:hypothetical protein